MTQTASDSGESMDQLIGRRVFHLMWDGKISQTQLASRLGIQQSSLSKKLRGERGWGADEIVIVARYLSTTVAALFGEAEEVTPDPDGTGAGTEKRLGSESAIASVTTIYPSKVGAAPNLLRQVSA